MQVAENVQTSFSARCLKPEELFVPQNDVNVPLGPPGLDTVSFVKSIWVGERAPAYHGYELSKG